MRPVPWFPLALSLAVVAASASAPSRAETIDFKSMGSFTTPDLIGTNFSITAESSPGVVGQVNVLNFNGLGVVGGSNNFFIDGQEALIFQFTESPVAGLSLFSQSLGNGNGDSHLGSITVQAFGVNGLSLGTVPMADNFDQDVSGAFSGAPISKVIIRADADLRIESTMTFTQVFPDMHWSNPASGTWDGPNWNSVYQPGPNNNMFIDPAGGVVVTASSSNRVAKSLTVGATSSGLASLHLDNGGDLTATNGVSVGPHGEIVVGTGRVLQAPTLTNAGFVRGDGQIDASLINQPTGQVIVSSGQQLQFTGTSNTNAGSIQVIGCTVQFTGALVNQASTGIITGRNAVMRFDGGLTNAGSLALSSGNSDVFGKIVNTGRIAVAGSASATFYDDLVQNGTFVVAKAGSTSAVAVLFGAFSGSGGFTGGGDVFVLGDLRPGNSPAIVHYGGNVFLGPSTNTVIDIAGVNPGQFDVLQIDGQAGLDGKLTINPEDFSFTPGHAYSFLFLTAGGGVEGQFAGLTDNSLVGTFDGVNLYIDYQPNAVVLYAVPEPSTYALLAIGLGMLGFASTRRRQA